MRPAGRIIAAAYRPSSVSPMLVYYTRRRMSILLDLCFSLVWSLILSSKLQNVFAGRPIFLAQLSSRFLFLQSVNTVYLWLALEDFNVYSPLKKKSFLGDLKKNNKYRLARCQAFSLS